MTEHLAAFIGSIVGVALGVVACYRLERWDSARRAARKSAERAAAMQRHPASGQTVESSAYNPRRVKP